MIDQITLTAIQAELTACGPKDFLTAIELLKCLRQLEPDTYQTRAMACGIGLRRIAALMRIDRRFGKTSHERLQSIGWTKLEVVSRIDPARCSDKDLLKLAESHSTQWLRAYAAEVQDGTKATEARKRPKGASVLLYFTPEQYEVFRGAVIAHGAEQVGRGLSGFEAALIKAIGGQT